MKSTLHVQNKDPDPVELSQGILAARNWIYGSAPDREFGAYSVVIFFCLLKIG